MLCHLALVLGGVCAVVRCRLAVAVRLSNYDVSPISTASQLQTFQLTGQTASSGSLKTHQRVKTASSMRVMSAERFFHGRSILDTTTIPDRVFHSEPLPPEESSRFTTSNEANKFRRPKVLITGLGVISGVGIGVEEFWENIQNGTNSCGAMDSLPTSFSCRVTCPVRPDQFRPAEWYKNPLEVKRTDRYGQFAMAAAKLAIRDGGLDVSAVNSEKFGVLIGSGIGGIASTQRELVNFMENPRKVSPVVIPAMIVNISPGSVAAELNARGPNFAVVSACASGTHSIGEAMRIIQRGDADVVLTGGSEATLTDFVVNGFNRLSATAKGWNEQPQRASRPFDAKRSGFVMGEGAGVLLLESEEHAMRRGAPKIYGELAGYGSSCDAYHVTAPRPDGSGLVQALEAAIHEAGVAKEDVGYINAHGTSTPLNDKTETLAIKRVWGDKARDILISSSKSMTGHCLGAAGGIEAVVAAKALETGIAPPTINLDYPDPECDLFYCPNQKVVREAGFRAVVSNSLGFGGQNAVLLMKKYDGPQAKASPA